MSTIEERLSRDIEAVTGGIVVTDSDLRDARVAVENRIEVRRQRDRRRGLVAAAAAAAVAVGVATWQGLAGDDPSPSPAPSGPPPSQLSDLEAAFLKGESVTAEVLPGVWRLDNATTLFKFTADGRFSLDDTGQLSTNPTVDGTYSVEDGAISVDVDGGSSGCAGQAITLRAVETAGGSLHVLPVGREASGCDGPSAPQWVLEPVLPAGYFSEIKNGPGTNWSPPTAYEAVQATWYDPRGGYLVELRNDGTFTTLIGTGEVADRGTWNVDPPVSRLTLVSGADSPTCRQGDLFVLDNLRAEQIGVLNLMGDLGRNDCDVAWKGTAWVRLAP